MYLCLPGCRVVARWEWGVQAGVLGVELRVEGGEKKTVCAGAGISVGSDAGLRVEEAGGRRALLA